MTDRGQIVWDEGSWDELAKYARKHGWKVKRLSPADKGTSLKDPQLLRKYGKGSRPIFTTDKTLHTQNPKTGGATAVVIQEVVPPKQVSDYEARVDEFFGSYTSNTLRGKVWTIHRDKKATKRKLNPKRKRK